jgi:hypothetical protein
METSNLTSCGVVRFLGKDDVTPTLEQKIMAIWSTDSFQPHCILNLYQKHKNNVSGE